MRKKLSGYKVFTFFNYIFMLMVIIVTAYPIYYVVVASFSDPGALAMHRGLLWTPLEPYTFSAYELVFSNDQIITGFKNTLIVLGVGLIVNLIFTVLGAFFMAVEGPKLKSAFAIMIIITMYFSGGLVPEYLNVRDLGLMNSLSALILPVAVNTTNLIIMKSAFQGIPASLIESARLDGASYLKVLIHVMLPLSKATIAVMVLYYGVAHWNSWFSASIYLTDSTLYPLQLVMRNIMELLNTNAVIAGVEVAEAAQTAELMKYALIVIVSFPILVLYPFLQKYFVKGVMIGAVKG